MHLCGRRTASCLTLQRDCSVLTEGGNVERPVRYELVRVSDIFLHGPVHAPENEIGGHDRLVADKAALGDESGRRC